MLSSHSPPPFQDGQTRLLQSCNLGICPLPLPLRSKAADTGAFGLLPCSAKLRGLGGDTHKGTVAMIARPSLCRIQLWP